MYIGLLNILNKNTGYVNSNPLNYIIYNNKGINQPKDKIDICFKGNTPNTEDITPINIKQLENINGIHCPSCGTKMFTQEYYDELTNRAKNINSAAELSELLNEHKDFITPNYKRVIYMTNNIRNIEDLTVPQYIDALKIQAYDEKVATFDYLKSYLNYYSEHFDGKQKEIIIEAAKNLDPNDNYFNNGKIIMGLCKNLNLDTNQSNELRRNTMQNLFLACRFIGGLNKVYPRDCQKSEKEITVDFVNQIFKHSLLKQNTIVSKSQKPNNVLIMCDECHNRQSDRAFWHNTSATGLKDNIKKYLEDVSLLMGEKKIDNSPNYIRDFCYTVEKVSRQNIAFSEMEIKHIKRAQNVLLRHEYFAPVKQSQVDVPCAECGTTMLPYDMKVQIAKELKQCETPIDFAEMLQKYDKYIGPHAEDISANFIRLARIYPLASNEDFLEIFRKSTRKQLQKQIKPIIKNYLSKRQYYIPDDFKVDNKYVNKAYSYNTESEKLRRFDLVANRVQKYVEDGKFHDLNFDKLNSECFSDIDLSSPNIVAIYSLLRSLNRLSYRAKVLTRPPFMQPNPKAELAETIYELFNMDAATADHLNAAKKGGANTIYNMVGLCRGCNIQKGSKSVNSWYITHPGVRRNFLSHMKVVDKMSKDGIISGYEDWAKQIAEQMYNGTNGKYDIRDEFNK